MADIKSAPWLWQRVKPEGLAAVSELMDNLQLHTVCQSASCPNIGECFGAHTAAFLILGTVCTRNCRFCAVHSGKPAPPDMEEAGRLAQAVRSLGLTHVVITSVTRDDLSDGGASLFVQCVESLRQMCPGTSIELLVPDFMGNRVAVDAVLAAMPEVFNHNMETVSRLYALVRPAADYRRSLAVLRQAAASCLTKSGLMLGLGEKPGEVEELMEDIREHGVSALTIGQYLQPSPRHLPVQEYIHPERFKEFEQTAYSMGFLHVVAQPLARSSYHAARLLEAAPGSTASATRQHRRIVNPVCSI